jgi:transposase
MEELVRLLCENFKYVRHEIDGDLIYIYVKSNRDECECPYCGTPSKKVHSRYKRRFRDLPVQGKKVEIVIENRKFFCVNSDCRHKTFAETFDCLPYKSKRSQRLTEAIMGMSLHVSSVTAARVLRNGVADVGKSTICNLLKKGRVG